jgi:hypothetical protein
MHHYKKEYSLFGLTTLGIIKKFPLLVKKLGGWRDVGKLQV